MKFVISKNFNLLLLISVFSLSCEVFTPYVDECGVVDGDNSCIDCAGTLNGNAAEDNCGVCDANLDNNCVQDCLGNWGGSAELQIIEPQVGENMSHIAAGFYHSLALTSDGNVIAWGSNNFNQTDVPTGYAWLETSCE